MSKCEKCGEDVDWNNPNIHYAGHNCKPNIEEPQINDNQLWKNNKNKEIYKIIDAHAINCTNSSNDEYAIIYTSYHRDGTTYIREHNEFLEKFTFYKEN